MRQTATAFRVESFTSEDNKIHGVAESSEVLGKAEKEKAVSQLVKQAYWVEVFATDTNELIFEHFPQ